MATLGHDEIAHPGQGSYLEANIYSSLLLGAQLQDEECQDSTEKSHDSCTGSNASKRAVEWSDEEESSSDSEPDLKRVRRRSLSPVFTSSGRSSLSSSDLHLRLPRGSDEFLDFCRRPGAAFVDKTPCIPELPEKFRYLLLRPPRFGKTTFLSTLTEYYDLREADRFTERFGSLAVATQAIPNRSQHLCLSFRMSDIDVHADITDVASQLASTVASALDCFIIRYASELQLPDPPNYWVDSTGDMFGPVFELIRASGHTLFVGIDDYDAPTQSRAFAHLDIFAKHEILADAREIERLLDSNFWVPLLAGSDVIDKLFITGTFAVNYPALQNLDMSDVQEAPGLRTCCGFTEEEASVFVQSVLDEAPMAELLRCCGNYSFPSQDGIAEYVLHPQWLIIRISELALQRPHTDKESFRLLSNLLDMLPAESDIPGTVSVDGLIDLLATDAADCEMDSPFDFDVAAPSWETLYYAGALIYDRHSAGTLRVANSAVLSLIHSRVDKVFSERHLETFITTWFNYDMQHNPQPFLELMSRVLQHLAQRSLGKKHEPNLRGIFELALQQTARPHRPVDPIILLPDADVTRVEIPAYESDGVHVWELKTLTLLGMWLGANPNDDNPTVDALQTLHAELVCLDDEELLARPYRVWSPTLNAMETVLVERFFDPEPEFPQFLAVGGARILRRDTVYPPLTQIDDDEAEDMDAYDGECFYEEADGELYYEEDADVEGNAAHGEYLDDGDGVGGMWP